MAEAIRLGRMLMAAMPGVTDTAGLLALMLLTDARQVARTTDGGELVPLDQQDRSLWSKSQIAEGVGRGPLAGLAVLGELGGDDRMTGNHRVEAVRAHLLARAGFHAEARSAFLTAARMTTSRPERRYLEAKAYALPSSNIPAPSGPA